MDNTLMIFRNKKRKSLINLAQLVEWVGLQSEDRRTNPSALHQCATVSLGKTLNLKLPPMALHGSRSTIGCEWVNVTCIVKHFGTAVK